MPLMISANSSSCREKAEQTVFRAWQTGCSGISAAANTRRKSARHHCNVVRAVWRSLQSSTTSSNSRQKAYNAVIASFCCGDKKRKPARKLEPLCRAFWRQYSIGCMARSQNHNGRIVAFFARRCRLLFKIRSAGRPERKQPAPECPMCRLLFAICALYFHGSHGVAPPYPRF